MANMRDNSWDNGGAARQGSRKPWLKWMLAGIGFTIGLPLLITAVIGSLALSNRSKVWPAVRSIHARLQTDAGARDLFVKNPALADLYANDQEFVDTVREWRPKVGDLPAQEPPRGPAYAPDVNPGEAAASVQGNGGAWMRVDIRGGALAGPVEGEGSVRIFFGEDKRALRSARRKASASKMRGEWGAFRGLMLQCADDAGAAALYRGERGLHARYPSEAVFLDAVRRMRPAIAELPPAPREDANEFGVRTFHTPFRHSRNLVFRGRDGQELVATWKSGKLSDLELRPARSHG